MITETCGCGASVQYPTKLGPEHARDWREAHRHEPEKPQLEHEELRAEVGFCLPNREEGDEE